MITIDIAKERKAFEHWWESFHNGRQISCDYVEEDNSYSNGYATAQWVAWQERAKAALEGFVLVPRELSDEKADAQALLAWGCYAGLFKSHNWDMSALQVEEFRLRWCKSKARALQEEYRVIIESQGQ